MTAVTQIHPQDQPATAAEAARTATSWPDLLKRPIRDDSELVEVQAGINRLTEPPRREWIMVRVAALLSQYYAADVPQSVVQIMAEDWAAELEQWPEWAIEKAVRWWKSADNKDRKRRPVEGDISDRARFEFGVVKVAKLGVKRYRPQDLESQAPMRDVPTERTQEEKDRVAALVAEAGFGLRRVDGGAV